MKKFCYLFCFLFVFALCFVPSAINYAYADDNFIIISDSYELNQIQTNTSANYRLSADINLSGQTIQPIQNFTGSFDGNGHTISNFSIADGSGNVGFFANTTGAKIYDVQFQNVSVSVQSDVDTYTTKIGIVCGLSQNSFFQNVSVVASTISVVTPSIQYVGSFVGHVQNGTRFENVTSDCSLTISSTSNKSKYVGGLVGYLDNSQVFKAVVKSNFDAVLSSGLFQGGAFGMILGNKTEIKNVIVDATCENSTLYGIGGLISYPNDMITNQSMGYIYTTVDGEYYSNTQQLISAHSSGDTTFDVTEIIASVVSSRNLMLRTFYETTSFDTKYLWDFDNIWQIEDTLTLPYLQHFSSFTYNIDKDRAFASMVQAPSVDAITILPSTNTFTYGESITIAGYINAQSQMNMFFEITGLRKDDQIIFSNSSVLDIIQDEDAVVSEVDENTTTYTLGTSTVTQTSGTVNNNAGTWYELNDLNILWGTYELGKSTVSVYEINDCTAQNSATYSFVVDAIEYDISVRSEDAVQGLVKRGNVQNIGQETVEDKISYGETLRYVSEAANDFGFTGWTISLDEGSQIFSTNLTLSITFNESLFGENGMFSGQTLDSQIPLVVYATFTKNVCDITFSFAVNGEVVEENLTSIKVIDSNGQTTLQPNEQGVITFKKPMESSITVVFGEVPTDYEFESWTNTTTGTNSYDQTLPLTSGEEESLQIVLNFTHDENNGMGMGYIWWIIGGSVAGILLIGLIVFLIVKKRKDNSYKNMYY